MRTVARTVGHRLRAQPLPLVPARVSSVIAMVAKASWIDTSTTARLSVPVVEGR